MPTLKTYSSLEKFVPGIEPTLEESKGSMLKGERYHFQVALGSETEYKPDIVEIAVGGSLAPYVTVRRELYVPAVFNAYPDHDDLIISETAKVFADALAPIEGGVQINRGAITGLWVTVQGNKDMPAGNGDVIITATQKGVSASVRYEIDVVDAVLPKSDLICTNWFHYDGLKEYYGLMPWTDEFFEVVGRFVRCATSHGINMLYTPLFTPPLDTHIGGERPDVQLVVVRRKNGEYSFDFSILNRFIDEAIANGVGYFEFSHLTTQWGAKACPKIMAHTENGYEKIFGWETSSTGDEYKKFLAAFLPALDVFLKAKGVAGKCAFHISDEPAPAHYEQFKEAFDFIRPLIKDYKVMDATSEAGRDLLDIPVMDLAHVPEKLNGNEWVYYCCSAYLNHVPNRFINMPSVRNRVLGDMLYLSGVKGFLQWGFNFYNACLSYFPINPFVSTDANGLFPAGDSFVVYPGRGGEPWDSLRLEVFFDAIQDRSALKLLESLTSRESAEKLLRDEGVEIWNVYPTDGRAVKNIREKVNAAIAAAGK